MTRFTRAWLGFVVAALIAEAAPAPLPRERNVPLVTRLTRCHTMRWAGSDYALTLRPCGFYEAKSGNQIWRGRWRLEGRRVIVRESLISSYDSIVPTRDGPPSWSVELDGELKSTGPGLEVSFR